MYVKAWTIKDCMRDYRRKMRVNALRASWVTDVGHKMARRLSKELGQPVTFVGPAGLRCRFWLETTDRALMLCFQGSREGFAWEDPSVDTKDFSEGTIGAMNGMNHPLVPIPDGTSLCALWRERSYPITKYE